MFNNNPLFQNVEKKTGVSMEELLKLATSIQHANLKDESTVRSIIQQVAKVANKPVNKATEDKIVNALVNNSKDVNFGTISEMLNNKK